MLQNKNKIIIFSSILVLTIVFIVVLIIILGNRSTVKDNSMENQNNTNNVTNSDNTETNSSDQLLWRLGANGYEAEGKVPDCKEPIVLESPVNINNVTSILYPGQTRGGNYKPHGGFRFDNNKTNEEDVIAPFDGYLVQATRLLVGGEIQYAFDIINPCGIMYRLGHLRELNSKFQAITDKLPEAIEGDSRFTNVNPYVKVDQGEKIATMIGLTSEQNTFLDFGVYDLREKNKASKDPSYASSHDIQLAQHGICWLDNLGSDSDYIKTLPAADSESGKNSDYCEY